MSAEVLRAAARLMRERAKPGVSAPPWSWEITADRHWAEVLDTDMALIARCADDDMAEHIASWHPAVALAVADWLDGVAAIHWPKRHDFHSESHYNAEPPHEDIFEDCDETCWREASICNGCGTRECRTEVSGQALTVARAYLGETS